MHRPLLYNCPLRNPKAAEASEKTACQMKIGNGKAPESLLEWLRYRVAPCSHIISASTLQLLMLESRDRFVKFLVSRCQILK